MLVRLGICCRVSFARVVSPDVVSWRKIRRGFLSPRFELAVLASECSSILAPRNPSCPLVLLVANEIGCLRFVSIGEDEHILK